MNKTYVIGDEEELVEELQKELFELKSNPNIIEIHDNATNGDMIKALFDCKIVEETPSTYVFEIEKDWFVKEFEKEWWNAPYKKGENK